MVTSKLVLVTSTLMAIALHQPAPARADSCANDYVTIETFRGIIMDIKPAPDPFPTADIYLSGPPPCARMWMQVMKSDAAKCRVGGAIAARGLVTSDEENNAWQIGSANNEYMTLGDDFTCS
jgi:hypothetical protein